MLRPIKMRLNIRPRVVTAVVLPVVLGVLLGPTGGWAAGLQGQVTDASTGQPLHSATISVESDDPATPTKQVITDDQGHFALGDLAPGTYRIDFSFIGYAPVTRQADVTAADRVVNLNVALTPQAIDMDAVLVSASRRPEKYVEAPASVVLVDAPVIQSTVALSTTDHLEKLPAVDASSTGLNTSNVVVRGFNNVMSTTLLSLVDYRIAQVPSLRTNAYQFLTVLDDDLDRLELVMGPGAALYGPNAADGIMHLITTSPFASRGTSLSLAGGERDLVLGSIRHAGTLGTNLGYRISGQYYTATDWKYYDPEERDSVTLVRQGPNGSVPQGPRIDNTRDFNVERLFGDLRLDWMTGRNTMLVMGAGLSRASNIVLTDLGAAQVRDWMTGYGQARFTFKDLFAQAYVNFSDAGDTYLRRDSALIVDRSRLYVGQIQHALQLGGRSQLVYGLDAMFTRPETDGTIHGRNESRDNVNELGAYAQVDVRASARLMLTAAARIDKNNLIDDPVISPRAGITLQAGADHRLRVTANRAFNTPTPTDFFLDVLLGTLGTPAAAIPLFGPTAANVRGVGAVDGFHFNRDPGGRPLMVSLYGDILAGGGAIPEPNSYLEASVNSVWPAMRAILVNEDSTRGAFLPAQLSQTVLGNYALLNPEDTLNPLIPVSAEAIQDVTPLVETNTTTYELGYKGRVGRLVASADVYYTRKADFVGPLRVETPNVFMAESSFVNTLRDDIVSTSGGLVDSGTAQTLAEGIYAQFEELPIGLASPQEVQNATDIIMTRRNYGLVDLVGADLNVVFHLNSSWNTGGTYSYLSQNLFRNVDGLSDVATNSPRHKFGLMLQYRSPRRAYSGQIQARWVDDFPVQSGVYVGAVQRYFELNLALTYRPLRRTEIALTVQNLLDNRHAEFVGAPELGRLAMLRINQRL